MNIMIFASTPISHIFPLKVLIKELLSKGNNVYCLSSIARKTLIEGYGAKFIEYPFDYEKSDLKLKLPDKLFEMKYLWDRKRYEEAMVEYLKYDIRRNNIPTQKSLDNLEKIIIDHKIDLIFRDAVDRHAYVLSKKLNIKTIGYITHNLYTKDFFKDDPKKYRIFLNCVNHQELTDDFLSNIYDIICILSMKEKIIGTNISLQPLHQFDPRNEFNLIFSTHAIQPGTYNKNIYSIIYPDKDRYEIEKDISDDLLVFVKNAVSENKKIVYISTGSIISNNVDYYTSFTEFLVNQNMKVIISLKSKTEKVIQRLEEKNLLKDVYIKEFVPQKYVLSNSSLFISSGGQNSILEAIFFQVPMLINPMTSEQRINGIWLEERKIAKTSYNISENKETIGKMIRELLTSQEIHENLFKCHEDMVKRDNSFEDMWKYIYEKN